MGRLLTIGVCVLSGCLAAGCASPRPAAVADVLTAEALDGPAGIDALQAADVSAPANEPVARVNGQPISRDRLVQCLIEAHGRKMLQAMVVLEVVKQQARAKNIVVTPADIDAEEAAAFPEELKKLTPQERDRVLDDYLERNGLTRVQWRLAIERQAYLRKLADVDVPTPKEEFLRELFKRQFGEKAEVRLIQVETAAKAREAEERLGKGEPFEQVAKALSTDEVSAAQGGLLPPFDAKDPTLPEEIRSVAFALEPGRVSGQIQVRSHIYLLKLEKKIPPADVKFENVRAELTRQVHDQLVRMQMNLLLRSLPAASKIEILEPVIKRQTERLGQGAQAPSPEAPR